MKKYAIVQSPNIGQLCGAIEKALNEGWECQGGINMTVVPVGVIDQKLVLLYAQSLIKEEKLVTS
jgi:hypothetical protein